VLAFRTPVITIRSRAVLRKRDVPRQSIYGTGLVVEMD